MLASWCYLCTPLISHSFFTPQPHKVMICGRHVLASVQDIKIAEALLMLCLAYYVMKYKTSSTLLKCLRHFGFRGMGHAFHEHILRIFHSYNGWMDCRDAFHAVLCLYFCVTARQNIAEYEAYWLMGIPIINLWGVHFTSIFSVFFVMLPFAYIAV